jgi:hypothetical protein
MNKNKYNHLNKLKIRLFQVKQREQGKVNPKDKMELQKEQQAKIN